MAASMADKTQRPTMLPGQMKDKEKEKIKALTKPEVMRVVAAEAALRPYQDEKMEIYHGTLDKMADSFAQARQGRGALAAEYERRNKEVLDRLVAMRTKTDREAKARLDSLKAFSIEFDQSANALRKAWKKRFAAEKVALVERNVAIGDTITELNGQIAEERKACYEHSEKQTGPIIEELKEHDEYLKNQIFARGEEYERFMVDMKERFAKLRRRLDEEKEVREQQCTEIRAKSAEHYTKLDAKISQKVPELKIQLDAIKERMGVELNERAEAQELIVKNMMQFMGEFETSIAKATERQEETKAHLMAMKATLREEADS
eukprot:TRINITY_DN11740_c0_g1_i1.p1 TRINITY_DN11740_c0_g1~~TRINITY_DN11740_c0_g1_i1.p1  ORF type:complete len:319 (-),score=91.32 TRINITY_DN11740_c0_g1_i1:115-1071(-)